LHNKTKPTISVVMATFNRSNLLQFSIGSLLKNSFQDWELIVVGDCCTDDTEQVVAAFNDSRIQFINLDKNVGEQSGPNNMGMFLAKGKYIAFLNHDDMWCSNHLQSSMELLEKSDADLVFSQALWVPYQAPMSLSGATVGHIQAYQPWMIAPATLWLFKTTLTEKVGTWRLSRDIHSIPSQDWLYRAHQTGAKILANPVVTAVILNSATRINAYSERQMSEHEQWCKIASDTAALGQAVSSAYGAHLQNIITMNVGLAIRRLLGLMGRKILFKLQIFPPDLAYWLRYSRKGSVIKMARKRRGL